MWLIGINVAVQLLRSLLGEETDNVIILMFGLVPAAYTGGSHDLLTQIAAPITYQFLHGGWMHLVINMVTLAAFGAPVERMLGVRRFVLFYLSAGIVAGFVQVVLYPDSVDPVIGASGAISRRVRRRADADALHRQPALALSDRRHLDRASTSSSACSAACRARAASRSPGPPMSAASSTGFSPSASSRRAACQLGRRRGRPARPAAPLSRRQRRGAGAVLRRPAGALLVGPSRRPADADRHGRHRRGHGLAGAALSRLARPLRPLRRRTVGRARARDAAPLLRARHRGAGDGGGPALGRLAPPARLDRQSRGLRPGDRRRPARSADRRRPRAAASCAPTSPPAQLLGPVGAERDLSTMFRQPQLLAAIDGAARDRPTATSPAPDQTACRVRAAGPARARHDRPSPPPAARGGRRLAGADRAARHHGAAPRRAHARRFRRQCQPRAQDADRGPGRLHRDPARAGARRREPRASASSASWPSRPSACAAWSTIC